jgi:glycosyltransferase involved in cell wall biosynthesis
MNDQVSIIVPVYNVEQYLEMCVESILNQTYDNLDIILVDDGSKDGSGLLCDKLSDLDKRIRVLHKENGGLSDARNAGTRLATGEYIGFIDSDDWIEPDIIESLINLMKDNNAQIAEMGVRFVFPDHAEEMLAKKYGVFTNIEAVAGYLDETIGIKGSACNKIYKTEIAKNNLFPVGRLHEDGWFMYKALYQCTKFVNTSIIGYNYRQLRTGSIMDGARKGGHKNYIDTIEAFEERNHFFAEKSENVLQKKAEAYYYRTLVTYLRQVTKNEGVDSDFRKFLALKIRNQENEILNNPYLGKWKIKYIGFKLLHPEVFKT